MKTVKSHFAFHEDHKNWQSEINMWLKDLENWYKEIDEGHKRLKQIAAALNQHTEKLEAYHRSVNEHQQNADKHEKELSLISEGSETDKALAPIHEKEEQRHEWQRDNHNRVKKYHHTVMTLINRLTKVMKISN